MTKPLPTAPIAPVPPRSAPRNVVIASYLLMLAGLMLVMWQHLLPGLLCACIGFLATRFFARLIGRGLARFARCARAATASRACWRSRWCCWRRSRWSP